MNACDCGMGVHERFSELTGLISNALLHELSQVFIASTRTESSVYIIGYCTRQRYTSKRVPRWRFSIARRLARVRRIALQRRHALVYAEVVERFALRHQIGGALGVHLLGMVAPAMDRGPGGGWVPTRTGIEDTAEPWSPA